MPDYDNDPPFVSCQINPKLRKTMVGTLKKDVAKLSDDIDKRFSELDQKHKDFAAKMQPHVDKVKKMGDRSVASKFALVFSKAAEFVGSFVKKFFVKKEDQIGGRIRRILQQLREQKDKLNEVYMHAKASDVASSYQVMISECETFEKEYEKLQAELQSLGDNIEDL